jgi:UDP-N-acetylmuramoyl-tripeptide--D-alanyl-D-alanine ligase
MNPLHTKDWDALLHGEWHGAVPESISGWAYDTRLLKPGECFLALKTDRRDGHDFLMEALAKGASAAWVSHIQKEVPLPQYQVRDPLVALQKLAHFHRKNFLGKVVGVTGTCGKTSTKDLLHHLLGKAQTFATEGNFNNFLGLPLMMLKLDPTQHAFGVFEVGISIPGEMDALAAMLAPDLGIVIAITPVHLDTMGDVQTVAQEKAKLLERVPAGAQFAGQSCLGFAPFEALKNDCHWVLPDGALQTHLLENAIYYTVGSLAHERLSLVLKDPTYGEHHFELRSLSDGMLSNVGLSIAVALRLEIPVEAIRERLATWSPSSLRGEWRSFEGKAVYLDCYNASPVSLKDALNLFQKMAAPGLPRLYIIGGMNELGSQSAFYHETVGASLHIRPQDQVYVIGPDAKFFLQGMLHAGNVPNQLHEAVDIDALKAVFQEFQGAVFIKGSHGFRLWEVVG